MTTPSLKFMAVARSGYGFCFNMGDVECSVNVFVYSYTKLLCSFVFNQRLWHFKKFLPQRATPLLCSMASFEEENSFYFFF